MVTKKKKKWIGKNDDKNQAVLFWHSKLYPAIKKKHKNPKLLPTTLN